MNDAEDYTTRNSRGIRSDSPAILEIKWLGLTIILIAIGLAISDLDNIFSKLVSETSLGLPLAFTFLWPRTSKEKKAINGSQIPIDADSPFNTPIEQDPEAVLVLDPKNLKYINGNKRAEALLGYSLEELNKLGPADISPHSQPNGISSRTLVSERISETLDGKTTVFEWTHKSKIGMPIPCEVRLVPMCSNKEHLIRASILDLRERKQHETERRYQAQRDNRRTDELAGLAIASASISSSLDLDKVLEIVAKQLAQLLNVPVCMISYLEDINQGNGPRLEHVNRLDPRVPKDFQLESILGDFDIAKIINRRSPIQLLSAGTNGNYHHYFDKAETGRILLLPLVAKSKTIGVIELHDFGEPGLFGERELYLAQTLSQQAANAIENARLFQSTNRQLIELQIIKNVATICTEALDEKTLLREATQTIYEDFDVDVLEFLLLSDDKKKLVLQSSSKSDLGIMGRRDNAIQKGVTGQVARSGKAICIANVHEEASYLMFDKKTIAELCVPIKLGNDVIGVINAESQEEGRFTDEDLQLVETLANQMASGIARLRHMQAQERKGRQLRILNELSSQMSGVLEKQRLFKLVANSLHNRMNYECAAIFTVPDGGSVIELELFEGADHLEMEIGQLLQVEGSPFTRAVNDSRMTLTHPAEILGGSIDEDVDQTDSVIILPIRIYQKAKYILLVSKSQGNNFDTDEIAALETLAEHMTVSLESITLFEATRRQLQELTVIHAIANAAMNARGEMELLERTTEIIGATLFPDKFGFLLLDKKRKQLSIHPSYRGADEVTKKKTFTSKEGLLGEIVSSGMPRRISDIQIENTYSAINPEIRSLLMVPLSASRGVIGVINAESVELDAFAESDLRLLSTIAGQIGNAIEKLRLYESEKLQRDQAETLQEVAAILGGAPDLSHVTDLILDELNRVVPFESASLQLIDGEDLVVTGVAGHLPESVVGFRLKIKEDKIAHPILFEKRTVRYEDVTDIPDWLTGPGTDKVKSWIGAPLVAHGKCIGVLTIDGYSRSQFGEEDARLVSSFAIHAAIAVETSRLFQEIEESYSQTVSALANAIDVRDSYTKGHSQRLAELAIRTGRELKCDRRAVDDIYWAALLHDIGKIGVPDHILRKPAKLTDEEFAIIKEHPEIGETIIKPITKLAHLGPVIRAHQERFDGKGYPDQLKGHEIPLAARIISVADAYVAMTDERVYHEAMSKKEAISEIKRCTGTQFDPHVVDAFLKVVRRNSLPH